MIRKLLAVGFCLTIAFVGCGANGLNRPRQKAWNVTFALWGHAEGKNYFLCTATAIAKVPGGYRLLTAAHCVDPSEFSVPIPSFTVAEVLDDKAPQYPVSVLKIVPEQSSTINADYAILELKTKKWYPVEKIVDVDLPKLGERVFVVHFAEGLGKQISEGRVSSQLLAIPIRQIHCFPCPNRILVQVVAGPGASGALVISAVTNRPIGIITGHLGAIVFVEPIAMVQP